MNQLKNLTRLLSGSARDSLNASSSRELRAGELVLTLGLLVGLIGAGTLMIQAGSGNGTSAAAATAPATTPESQAPETTAPAKVTPVRKRTAKSRLSALRHPLVGTSRAKLLSRLGPPTRRTTEGGAAMELLEYAIGDSEYQVVVLDRRVVEVNRFR